MNLDRFFSLIQKKEFDVAEREIKASLPHLSGEEIEIVNHQICTIYLIQKKLDQALEFVQSHRWSCGSITHAHETIAMIHEMMGNDDLALAELESAPFQEEESCYPLLVVEAKFYRLFFKASRGMAVTQIELDEIPHDYESYLPSNGNMRGVLVTKNDILSLVKASHPVDCQHIPS